MALQEVIVPDLGGAEEVDVIEISVKPGDQVNEEDPLITLESDKASMEVPSPFSGVVKELKVAVGDKLAEGGLVAVIETQAAQADDAPKEEAAPAEKAVESKETMAPAEQTLDVTVPDLGGADEVDVIEVSVKVGDSVNEEDGLFTLESDKASMEVPAPFSGVIESINVKVGDKVSEGALVASIKTTSQTAQASPKAPAAKAAAPAASKAASAPAAKQAGSADIDALTRNAEASAVDSSLHASPVVRRIASEFGVDLRKVKASGPKGRIVKEDVQLFIKQALVGGGAGSGLPQMPAVDFSKWGDVETKPLNKIQKLTGKFLSRNWLLVPHVTQFNDADITDMEAFRKENKADAESQGFKLTPLAFIMKAVEIALKDHPKFNSSLSSDGQSLVLKKYFHIGVAVDTPNGLVVPVVKDVDQKSIMDIAKELGEISVKAREGKLLPRDMQGACFTISSLGGIGGTAFTPIVNAPEVAILGVSRAQMKPVYEGGEFVPRLMLPLALSYDHRVVDGADGARFIMTLSKFMSDVRQLAL
jgi:pyruvate dehydrogenase E2 component (dihydrolipoamide acetyltransferase)